jgi:hypothetical protein
MKMGPQIEKADPAGVMMVWYLSLSSPLLGRSNQPKLPTPNTTTAFTTYPTKLIALNLLNDLFSPLLLLEGAEVPMVNSNTMLGDREIWQEKLGSGDASS